MKRVDLETRLRQIAWPTHSADLRARVLSGIPAAASAVTWSDRVWFSRAWRLAGVSVLVLLLGLEYLAGRAPLPVSAPPSDTIAVVAEAVRDAGLSADQAEVLARRMVSATERPRTNAAFRELGIAPFGIEGETR